MDDGGNSHVSNLDGTNGDLKYAMGSLACPNKPAEPIPISPENRATPDKRRVLLNWSDVDCFIRYEVVVKEGSKTGFRVARDKNLTQSLYKTEPLTRGQVYFWRVRACNEAGCSGWTKYWKFRVSASAPSISDNEG